MTVYLPNGWRKRLNERLENLRRPKRQAACEHDWNPEHRYLNAQCLKCGHWGVNDDYGVADGTAVDCGPMEGM